MQTEDKAGKWKKVIIGIVGVVIILMLLIGLFAGFTNLRKFFTWLLGGLLILAIIFGLAYIFWLVFLKKEYVDIPANFHKRLVKTAMLMKNEMLGDLYLTGDSKHNRIKLGKYAYLRMQLPKQTVDSIEVKEKGEFGDFSRDKEVNATMAIDIDCFIVLKQGFMDKLFGKPLFIMVKPEDHDYSAIFNQVNLRGMNLYPISENFYTLEKRCLDTDLIKGMSIVYQKEVVDEIFRNLDRLVKMSINLDQQHRKDKEKQLQFDIPQINTGDK